MHTHIPCTWVRHIQEMKTKGQNDFLIYTLALKPADRFTDWLLCKYMKKRNNVLQGKTLTICREKNLDTYALDRVIIYIDN